MPGRQNDRPSDEADTTIFALASARGRAGVAVVRVSGPAAADVLAAVTRGDPPEPRQAALRTLRHPTSGAVLDRALTLFFNAPRSFTGEDVLELHLHGGPAVIDGVLDAIGGIPACRPAAPGEFTRRAFENDRLDLTEAEAIADLVNAETAAQKQQALRQMEGHLGRLYEDWRGRLMRVVAHLEADIDFPDEDLPEGFLESVRPAVESLAREIRAHLDDGHRGERVRDGVRIAILGPPNVGKSSLINALAERDVAIVSDIAGTTRDVIEVHLDLGGYPVTVLDTAGLRRAKDVIEAEGVRRAEAAARDADFRLLMMDASDWPRIPDVFLRQADDTGFLVLNKAELQERLDLNAGNWPGAGTLAISVTDGGGLRALMNVLTLAVRRAMEGSGAPVITRMRHRQALEDCMAALTRVLDAPDLESELGAEDLRLGARSIGTITGRVDVEDMLDLVFSEFCIGK